MAQLPFQEEVAVDLFWHLPTRAGCPVSHMASAYRPWPSAPKGSQTSPSPRVEYAFHVRPQSDQDFRIFRIRPRNVDADWICQACVVVSSSLSNTIPALYHGKPSSVPTITLLMLARQQPR